jgi:internalin A
MQKISAIFACMASLLFFWPPMGNAAIYNLLQPEPPLSQPLPAAIITAWEKAGAKLGWMTPQGDWIIETTGRPGDIPAFLFNQWAPGLFSKLPGPNEGFGLELAGTTINDSGLKELAKFTPLQSLDLTGTNVTDAGLKQLAGLTQLQSLDISDTDITDAGLLQLAPLAQLQSLGLSDTGVTDAGLKQLSGLMQLQELDLSQTAVTDAGLKQLAGFVMLGFLDLTGTHVTDMGVAELQQELTNIQIIFRRRK